MNLENFPMDVQRCPLKLGSCKHNHQKIFIFLLKSSFRLVGYTTSDVLYKWNSRAVVISDDLRMSQFDLIDVPSSNESVRVGSESGTKIICKLKNSIWFFFVEIMKPIFNFFINSLTGIFSFVSFISSPTSHGQLPDSSLWSMHP